MCQLKSCLVLKDRVFCPDYNSHQSMLEELGIKDDYLHASKIFVRVELTPPDGIRSPMEPLDRWTLKVDQDIVPEWWDEKADRQRVEEAVEIWRKGHVFAEGEHSISAGIVYALGRATVKACGSTKVEAYGRAMVKAWDRAMVKACDNATVTAHDRAMVGAHNSVTVKAHGNAKVKAFDRAIVRACNSATVEAFDSAMVVYPEERKIIYPAGWTTKMHE